MGGAMYRGPMSIDRRLLAYLKPHGGTIALGLFCAAMVSTITVTVGALIKRAIDAMANGHVDQLNWTCAGVLVIFLFKGMFGFGQSYFLSLSANRLGAGLRDEIY